MRTYIYIYIYIHNGYGQLSKVSSGKTGPAPGGFELPKGILGRKQATVLGLWTLKL